MDARWYLAVRAEVATRRTRRLRRIERRLRRLACQRRLNTRGVIMWAGVRSELRDRGVALPETTRAPHVRGWLR